MENIKSLLKKYGHLHSRRMEKGRWYWMDKAIIRHYTPLVGTAGITVYNYLASLANREQCCYPSQRHLAKILVLSRTTIGKSIKLLEKHHLIAVDKSGRYQQKYRLLYVSGTDTGKPVSNNSQIMA
jgi:replication initiation and membrane attachment protein DnaB